MPDDVGGRPFPDGWEPDDDRGGADEDFASVVFDEDFVRAAEVHEPSAVERLLAAAEERSEAEAARRRSRGGPTDDGFYNDSYDSDSRDSYGPSDEYRPDGLYGRHGVPGRASGAEGDDGDDTGPYGAHGGALRPYRGAARWHRPVAWLLAVVMAIGMVALAFTAVYRGAASSRQGPVPPPATSGVGTPGAAPSASVGYSRPAASAGPRTS